MLLSVVSAQASQIRPEIGPLKPLLRLHTTFQVDRYVSNGKVIEDVSTRFDSADRTRAESLLSASLKTQGGWQPTNSFSGRRTTKPLPSFIRLYRRNSPLGYELVTCIVPPTGNNQLSVDFEHPLGAKESAVFKRQYGNKYTRKHPWTQKLK